MFLIEVQGFEVQNQINLQKHRLKIVPGHRAPK